MADLTDKEIIEACARAAGINPLDMPYCVHCDEYRHDYNPLTDRAQAMELVEKLLLRIAPYISKDLWLAETMYERGGVSDKNLLRAICLCAARVQIEKEKKDA